MLACLCCLALAEAQIVYQGCWANADRDLPIRALPFRAAANNFMDPDFCKQVPTVATALAAQAAALLPHQSEINTLQIPCHANMWKVLT